MAAILTVLFATYLRRFDRIEGHVLPLGEQVRDLFDLMTYRQRYDVLRESFTRDVDRSDLQRADQGGYTCSEYDVLRDLFAAGKIDVFVGDSRELGTFRSLLQDSGSGSSESESDAEIDDDSTEEEAVIEASTLGPVASCGSVCPKERPS